MLTELIGVQTGSHSEFTDITQKIESFINRHNIKEGFCHVYIPHTTCGVTINENADPDVKKDMLMELGKIVPLSDGYSHMEGNSAAHIKSSLMGFSLSIPVFEGRLLLGTWQGVYLCEFDGPRNRKVRVSV
ncbi:MAG: secondary thiamine-phosphate synthase enzyme YjbQ [Spirochaetia bacterium]|jgi:secondary thiamine-phosphate synthase enzyme|nr:secondary thiamine-phosphate synthase enzyme YjbQ [Spirochaetia bacterium]